MRRFRWPQRGSRPTATRKGDDVLEKQELRNALSAIEDDARELRARAIGEHDRAQYTLVARLTQLIREEIVR